MTEFSTSALLEIEVSQSSLKSARKTIQSEFGGVEVGVDASASNQLSSQNKRPAGKERAMSRQLLAESNNHLVTTTDHLQENLTLNESRNDLLREIRDAQELTARESSGGGRARSLGRGSLGLGSMGLLVAGALTAQLASVNWGSTIGNALPEIGPDDIIGSTVGAADLIADTVGASDFIDSTVGDGDLVGNALPVGASALVASALPVGASALVASGLPVGAADVLAEALPLGSGDLVQEALPVGAAALVASALPLGPGALVASALPIGAGALVGESLPITADDIISVPSGGIPIVELLAGSLAIGALAKGTASRIGQTGGAAASTLGPLAGIVPGLVGAAATGQDDVGSFYQDELGMSMKTHTGKETDPISAFLANTIGRFANLSGDGQTTYTGTNSGSDGGGRNDMTQNDRTIQVTNDVSIDNSGKDDREVERLVERRLDEFERGLDQDIRRL